MLQIFAEVTLLLVVLVVLEEPAVEKLHQKERLIEEAFAFTHLELCLGADLGVDKCFLNILDLLVQVVAELGLEIFIEVGVGLGEYLELTHEGPKDLA